MRRNKKWLIIEVKPIIPRIKAAWYLLIQGRAVFDYDYFIGELRKIK